jgi:hypothetical protein
MVRHVGSAPTCLDWKSSILASGSMAHGGSAGSRTLTFPLKRRICCLLTFRTRNLAPAGLAPATLCFEDKVSAAELQGLKMVAGSSYALDSPPLQGGAFTRLAYQPWSLHMVLPHDLSVINRLFCC